MKNKSLFILAVVFCVLVVCELMLVSTLRESFGPKFNSIAYAVVSLAAGIVFIALSIYYTPSIDFNWKPKKGKFRIYVLVLMIVGSAFIVQRSAKIFNKVPVNEKQADIIPTAQTMARIYMEGKQVYTEKIVLKTYTMKPGRYVPLRFMPYIISEKFDFDPRWLTIGVTLLAIGVLLFFPVVREGNYVVIFIKAAVCFVFLFDYIDHHKFNIAHTNEMMVAGFYMLSAALLFSSNTTLQVFGLSFALLSRLNFVFFIPVYFITLLIHSGWKKALQVGFVFALVMLCSFIFPFDLYKPEVFNTFIDSIGRTFASLHETWTMKAFGKVVHMYNGLGLTWIFHAMDNLEVQARIDLLKKVLNITTIVAVIGISGFYFWKKEKANLPLYLLGAAKIIIAIFYSLAYIPYDYLYVVPLFFSVAMLMVLPFREVFLENKN